MVLENGTIEDIGPHEQLMQKPGTYRRLYDLQFAEAEPPKRRGRALPIVAALAVLLIAAAAVLWLLENA